MAPRSQRAAGWAAVGVSTIAASFWGFWGIIENFHEGWYAHSIWVNLGMMVIQYLFLPILFVAAALVAIRWPRWGGALHAAAAIWILWFFQRAAWSVLYLSLAGPLFLVAAGYWFGRPVPRRWAAAVAVGVPLLVILICGAAPAYWAATRHDDGDRSARRITGNGVDLVWAPAGPGWPSEGTDWAEAQRRCQFLADDGLALADTPPNVWRLPTVDEAVRSMHRHGENSSGAWDAKSHRATYRRTPDKESPLWDIYSPVIYWWTVDEANEKHAYIVVYNGQVWPRPKGARWGYLAFRAVRSPAEPLHPTWEEPIANP